MRALDAAGADTWVIVPGHNEEAWIGATIDALARQERVEITVLVIDNASTDGTAEAVAAAAERHPELDVRCLREDEKGTGAASDTGARHAIACGASVVLRTDSDCVPDPGWARTLRSAIVEDGLDLVGGNLRMRADDGMASRVGRLIAPGAYQLIRLVGRFRPNNNDNPSYRTRFYVVPGANLGIRASTYLESGGFPRTCIEDVHEDKAIVNAVRLVSDRVGYRRDAMVRFSNRRAARIGLSGVLRWYFNHGGEPIEVDVR